MKIINHNSKNSKDKTIFFPVLQCWNPVTQMVTIAAQVYGKRVLCSMAIMDLKKKYHVFDSNPLKVVAEHRKEIEMAAKKLIERESYNQDGTISICYKDL